MVLAPPKYNKVVNRGRCFTQNNINFFNKSDRGFAKGIGVVLLDRDANLYLNLDSKY
jgi:hypothetical protein